MQHYLSRRQGLEQCSNAICCHYCWLGVNSQRQTITM